MTDLSWLSTLRTRQIVKVVQEDPRTSGTDPLGLPMSQIANEVIGGGQADFSAPWGHLSPADRALLYAYCNQPGHITELTQAFTQLFAHSSITDPIVLDLGCGPFTGGLALAAVLGATKPFTYIGVDRAPPMWQFGEQLALAAVELGGLHAKTQRQWVADLDRVQWTAPLGWRPVVVIVSYLLASPTLDAAALVGQLERLLGRLSFGPVTVLYTNSPRAAPNRSFPQFRAALQQAGFAQKVDDTGQVTTSRGTRKLRYSLFVRQKKTVLDL